MPFVAGRSLTFYACVAVIAVAMPSFVRSLPTTSADQASPAQENAGEDKTALESVALAVSTPSAAGESSRIDQGVKETSLVETNKGPSAHSGHSKPMHMKKKKPKKPMGKHKKKKQTFKDKLLPLLLIPFVIQTMLIPMFIMNLKMLAMKAMTVGKIAILLILFNMFRSWSQNAHSTSVQGSTNSLMAQNYGYNGGPEFGSWFNGR